MLRPPRGKPLSSPRAPAQEASRRPMKADHLEYDDLVKDVRTVKTNLTRFAAKYAAEKVGGT
jgi:hypothetical protein